ncbi:MAG: LON peptidase substrate-binding domain-containing protein [Fimbriimonadaceae bacterium]|nr:LON peptidase substrate-binding domain-containing protein [Alphaproteobacteria bacterium]
MSLTSRYRSIDDLPDNIPVFPLPEVLLLPKGQLPLNIFEPRYLAMVDAALAGSRLIGMIQPIAGFSDLDHPELTQVGTAGRITTFAETGEDRVLITLTGISRFRTIKEIDSGNPFRRFAVDFSPFANDLSTHSDSSEIDRPQLLATLSAYVHAQDVNIDWDDVNEASDEALVNGLAMLSPYGLEEKQALLEAPDLKCRADLLIALTEVFLRGTDLNPGSQLQ